jgi:hypothetical protein
MKNPIPPETEADLEAEAELVAMRAAEVEVRGEDHDELADLKLAIDLLRGFTEQDDKRLPVQKYFEEDSKDEINGRKALARLLRNPKPLDSYVRNVLADLFDPLSSDESEAAHEVRADRQLQFTNVNHRNREDARRAMIAHEVVVCLRKTPKVNVAIADVAQKFKISTKTVWNAWEQYNGMNSADVQLARQRIRRALAAIKRRL